MRRNISLWIDGQRADINDSTLIQFNYSQTDLNNPTIVRNSYSQSVELPATPTNNRIFGSYYRLDRVTGSGFNPWLRTPFRIMNDRNEILESGYFKLDKVTRKDGGIYSYSISLYGGLGGFFYQLSSNSEGVNLNLGDLLYSSPNYSVRPNDADATMTLSAGSVSDCWREACGQTKRQPSYSLWSFFLQFAPCYNGIPENFDANKCLVNAADSTSVRDFTPITLSSTQYAHRDLTNKCVLVTMASPKDEWVMRDFRAYLQRPVLNVREVFRAIPNSISDYRFSWTAAVNSMLDGLWITLLQPKRYSDYSNYPMRNIFEKSITPAQLLIGIAKTFNLVFRFTGGEVQVMTRKEYYASGVSVNLDGRVDRSREMSVSPYYLDAKLYVWKNDIAEGGYAKGYKDTYEKTFGQQIVNTNYNFNDETKDVLEKIAIRSGVMTAAASELFQFKQPTSDGAPQPVFVPAMFETCKYGYFRSDGVTPAGDITITQNAGDYSSLWYNDSRFYVLYDFAERLELSDASNKPVNGANILLYADGYNTLPYSNYDACFWHVSSDDDTAFAALNNRVPCYDLRRVSTTAVKVDRVPRYSRYHQGKSLDFGKPLVQPVPWLILDSYTPIYAAHWADYIADRMDKDTKVLRCFVDLRGLDVGQDLLRNIYYFNNSIWVLSKVENYMVGGNGVTQCEFIKVQNIDNYR